MIDRLTREKTSLVTDLELYKERMQRQEFDLCQVKILKFISFVYHYH